MTNAKTPVRKGPSALDVMSKYRTPRLVKGSTGQAAESEVDPAIESIQAVRERMLAQRMLEVTLAEQEADVDLKQVEVQARKYEAQAAKMEAEVKMEEMQEKRASVKDGGMTPLLMALVEKSMTPKDDSGISPQLEAVLGQMAANIQALSRTVVERMISKEEPPKTFVEQMQEIILLRNSMNELFPQEKPPAVVAAANSIQEAIMIAKLEQDHKLAMLEIDERRYARESDTQAQRERLAAETDRTSQLGGMFAKAIESVAPVIQDLARRATGTVFAPEAAAYAVPAQPMPIRPMVVPVQTTPLVQEYIDPNIAPITNGNHHEPFMEPCPHCGQLITPPEGSKNFPCPRCGQYITIADSEEEYERVMGSNGG